MSEKKETYGKPDLVNALIGNTMMNKTQAEVVVDTFVAAIKEAVNNGKKVSIKEFMTIHVKDASERKGRNPRTGEAITIPAHKRVVAKARFGAK